MAVLQVRRRALSRHSPRWPRRQQSNSSLSPAARRKAIRVAPSRRTAITVSRIRSFPSLLTGSNTTTRQRNEPRAETSFTGLEFRLSFHLYLMNGAAHRRLSHAHSRNVNVGSRRRTCALAVSVQQHSHRGVLESAGAACVLHESHGAEDGTIGQLLPCAGLLRAS